MAQVDAVLTPSTAPRVAGAIIAAYRDLFGRDPPTKNSWLWPLALSANETDSWTSMYNWNVGAVTTGHPDTTSWFYNPRVTSASLKFVSFDGPFAGARSMLRTLKQHGGIDAADAGDQNSWQLALNGYLGAGKVYPPLWARVTRLQNTVPEGGFEGESLSYLPTKKNSPVLLVGATALALVVAAGYAAYWRREALS